MSEPTVPRTGWASLKDLNRYQWFVFVVCCMAWDLDCLDQQLFVLARQPALSTLVGEPSNSPKIVELGGYATAVFMIGWAIGGIFFGILGDRLGRVKTLTITIGLYALFSAGQIGFYFATKGYRTEEISRELTRIAEADGKPNALVLGDWAPNFVVDTKLHSAPVFAKLANDDDPVGKLRADYILTSADRVHAALWHRLAPLAYRPENRVAAFPLYQYTLELYRVPR